MWVLVVRCRWSVVWLSSCPPVAGGQAFGACPLLSWRVPCLLSVISPCAWCISLKYGSISRFKGVFRGFWGCCVGLCCLGGLRGLWGFCTRVELGGLKACGVFAFVFPILCPFISVFALLLSLCLFSGLCLCYSLLILFACFVCPCGLVDFVVVSFSLSDICAKRKGAIPCVLSSCLVGLFISS